MPETIFTEKEFSELRRLRDLVYVVPSTDHNWEHCRDAWMRDRTWLISAAASAPTPKP